MAVRRRSKSKKLTQKNEFYFPLTFLQSFLYVVLSVFSAYVIFVLLHRSNIIQIIGPFRSVAALISGMFFTSVFTAAPGGAMLITLAETMNPLVVSILGGVGAMFGDIILMLMIQQGANQSISLLPDRRIVKIIGVLRHTRYRFMLTVLGAIVVASPLPDELGLALMGLSRTPLWAVFLLAFLFNTVGIWALVTIL